MNKKTVAIFAVCMLLVSALSVFATLALLTDSTNVVTNTFTSGNVSIVLDEKDLSDDAAEDDRTVSGNSYKLIPNEKFTKDPKITVQTGSEDCYVGAVITIENANNLPADAAKDLSYFGIELNAGWELNKVDTTGDDWTFAVVYNTPLIVGDDSTIFYSFTTPDFTNEELEKVVGTQDGGEIDPDAATKILVQAYAVQSSNLAEGTTAHGAMNQGFSTTFSATKVAQ